MGNKSSEPRKCSQHPYDCIAILIDPGEEETKVYDEIQKRGLTISCLPLFVSSFTPDSPHLSYTRTQRSFILYWSTPITDRCCSRTYSHCGRIYDSELRRKSARDGTHGWLYHESNRVAPDPSSPPQWGHHSWRPCGTTIPLDWELG